MKKDMNPLAKTLRTQLENTVKAARDVAEKAGKAALTQLAVNEAKAPDYLSTEQKTLRRSLRAHGRALGDVKHADDTQGLQHLIWEVAYEHWHRMLFARFLAESGLLMWEPGAAVSLDDCRDMWTTTRTWRWVPKATGNWPASWPLACCRRPLNPKARCLS